MDRLLEIAKEEDLTHIIAEKGDIILYRGGGRGETAKAFNALAKAVAIMAFFPGGATVFGDHYAA